MPTRTGPGRPAGEAAGGRSGPRGGAAPRPGARGCGSAVRGRPIAPGTQSRRRPRRGLGPPAGCRATEDGHRRRAPSAGSAGPRWCRESSRRLWHRSIPPTKATSRSGSPRMSEHDQLLVVRPERAHPHVEEALPPGRLDLLAQVPVLARAEVEPVQVRAPDEAADIHPSPGSSGEDVDRPRCPARAGARPGRRASR